MIDPLLLIGGAAAGYTLFGPGRKAPTKVEEIARNREREANAILKELTPREKAIEAKKFARQIVKREIPPEKRQEILKSPEEVKALVNR